MRCSKEGQSSTAIKRNEVARMRGNGQSVEAIPSKTWKLGEVPHRAPQPVQPRDDEAVAFTQNGEDFLQLCAAIALRAARLLLEDGNLMTESECRWCTRRALP